MHFSASRPDSKGGRVSVLPGGALTIFTETTPPIEIVASKPEVFHYWCDAINYLLEKKPFEDYKSAKFSEEMELLLGHEVRLRLLDLEDVELPCKAPIIPPLPTLPVPAGIF